MDFLPDVAVTTLGGRIAALAIAGAVLAACLFASARLFSRSFFHGCLVAVGIFASFDIVLIHWVFKLHRITDGPEADVIEPALVVVGLLLIAYGLRREPRRS